MSTGAHQAPGLWSLTAPNKKLLKLLGRFWVAKIGTSGPFVCFDLFFGHRALLGTLEAGSTPGPQARGLLWTSTPRSSAAKAALWFVANGKRW